MRVSDSSKIDLVTRGLNDSGARANSITETVASGKKINRPSDDPVGSAQVAAFKADISRNEAALKNSNIDRLWLDTVDSTTEKMVDALRYAKVKALEASNSFQSPESWEAIASEVDALKQELMQLGNTKINNIYIYSGSKTFTAPLTEGWPFQLPGIKAVPGLFRSKVALDDQLIAKMQLTADEEENTKPILLDFSSSYDLPENSPASANTRGLTVSTEGASAYQIEVSRGDSPQQIVDKLNHAMAGKYNNEKSDAFPTGFKQDAHFYLGPDNKLYAQTLENVSLGFAKTFTKNIDIEGAPTSEAVTLASGDEAKGNFGEYAEGFNSDEVLLRVTKAGKIGEAFYTVSTDSGKTWSPNRQLVWNNELFNVDGLTSTNSSLNFTRPDLPIFFNEGMEFSIKKNDSVIYQGNDVARTIPLDGLNKENININAKQLFFKNDKNSVDVFNALDRLQANIRKGEIDEIAKETAPLDKAIDQVLQLRAKSGIRTRSVEAVIDRVGQKNLDSTRVMSELEDADMAKAATDLNLNTVQRQAIMETTARILQPSLVQFLR